MNIKKIIKFNCNRIIKKIQIYLMNYINKNLTLKNNKLIYKRIIIFKIIINKKIIILAHKNS